MGLEIRDRTSQRFSWERRGPQNHATHSLLSTLVDVPDPIPAVDDHKKRKHFTTMSDEDDDNNDEEESYEYEYDDDMEEDEGGFEYTDDEQDAEENDGQVVLGTYPT